MHYFNSLLLVIFFTSQAFSQKEQHQPLPTGIVYVDAIGDFPIPQNGGIILNSSKVYIISGSVDIGQNYINLNGAGITGLDPTKDRIISTVKGAVLRSSDVDVYMEKVCVIPLTPLTTAYNFEDNTRTKSINLLAGNSVVEAPRMPSGGVGRISGFNSIYITSNYWKCRDGLKIAGTTGKFCSSFDYITGISSGIGLEFMPDFDASDIDLSNNYFVFSGSIAVKFHANAKVDQGRMSSNLFRGPAMLLSGFDSFTPGWEMNHNGVGIPDTKPYAFVYMEDNQYPTRPITSNLYTKVAGETLVLKASGFTTTPNRITYTGKRPLNIRVYVTISGKALEANADLSIAVFKNSLTQIIPASSLSVSNKNEGFQLTLETIADIIQGDYLEVFVKNNVTTTQIIVRDLQFRVSE